MDLIGLLLQWSGCLTGVVGAGLLASKKRYAGWGFVAFQMSNLLWAAYGFRVGTWSIVVMQGFYTVTSVIGIYRWLIQPSTDISSQEPQ